MEDFFSKFQAILGNNFSKYSNSEVITPLNIVNDMVDLLPADVFNPDAKFLDPAVKSGRFLAEIYRRLFDSPLLSHMNEADRKEHILKKQLYGFATSATAATIVRKQLYDDATIAGNIVYAADKVTKELIQGAFDIMKFDVVIGNPPYNKGMDLDFVDLGYKLSKKYTCMITPAKWQTAADDYSGCASKNIDYKRFRELYVPHMRYVCFYPDCKDAFNIGQIDGITYFLLDKEKHDKCTVKNVCRVQQYFNSKTHRNISNRQSLHNVGNEIVEFLGDYKKFKFSEQTGRFQYWVNNQVSLGGATGNSKTCTLTHDGKCKTIGAGYLLDSTDIVSMATKSGASTCAFSSNDIQVCEYFISWLNCKFTRFFVLINISKLTGIINDDCFRFVPAPPSGKFDHIYTDEELYKAFNLPQKYIDAIEAVVKERK